MINYDKIKEEYHNLSAQLSSEEIVNNRLKYQELAKRFSFLEKIVSLVNKREVYVKEHSDFSAVISDNKESEEFKAMAREEIINLNSKIKDLEGKIEDSLFEESEPDGDVIVEIRAAAGGEESALFAANLFKMYNKYAENKGWKIEVLDSHATEIKGFKEIIFSVVGRGAYSHLKFESGVHRVQRVPDTEASGRVHTSTTTVAVLIEPKEIELKLKLEDIRIDTYRASGAGGQHVNRTDSAVRMTHAPTGIVVCCQDERSQIKNRAKAMKILKLRIMERMEREQTDKVVNNRRVQIGSGERSEKIRTYNYPERRITDHRINFTTYRLEQVLEGDLDEIMTEMIRAERKNIYEAKGLA